MIKSKFLVSWKNIILGISFGVLFAYILFTFSILLRDHLRLFYFDKYYYLYLSKQEIFFYNFVFAFITLLISKSLIFSFWIQQNSTNTIKSRILKRRVISEQWNFILYFVYFFTKTAILIGFITIDIYYFLNTYENFFYLYILLLLVLFLQSWQVFNLRFKKGYLLMLKSFVFITSFAFIFAFFSINNEKKLIEFEKKHSIIKQKNINLPLSIFHETQINRSNIYLFDKNKKIFTLDLYDFKFYNEKSFSENNDNFRNYRNSQLPILNLNIDQSVKMREVNNLKVLLLYNGVNKINYKVLPKNPIHNINYYRDCILPINLFCIYKSIKTDEPILKIHIQKNNVILNEKTLNFELFNSEFRRIYKNKPQLIIELYADLDAEFKNYILIYSIIKKESLDYKNRLSIKKYNVNYNELVDKVASEDFFFTSNLYPKKKQIIDSIANFRYCEIIPHSDVKDFFNYFNTQKALPPLPPSINSLNYFHQEK
jgi:biopolymer transport protein ExbD